MPAPSESGPIPGSILHDRQVEVETPEHVAVGYILADLGSRFTALLLDGLVLGSALLVLWIGLPLLAAAFGGLPRALAGVGLALLVFASFLLVWGYFVYFEGLRDGQTPGKRWLGLRVVQEGGYPVTLRAAAVRNLLRVVDAQPLPTWALGGVVMLLHPRTKRLGDIAAGTVVVRERAEARLPEVAAARPAAAGEAPRLDDAEFETLTRFVARQKGLQEEARRRIARQMLKHLAPRLGEDRRVRMVPADELLREVHAEEVARRGAAAAGALAGSPQASALLQRQSPAWAEYRALLERARRRGLAALPEHEVSRFAALYREAAADLARARAYGASPDLLYALERQVGAGHNLLYRPGARSWRQLRDWLAFGFPALVRLRWRPIALAALCLFVPLFVSLGAVYREPARARELLPPGMIARAEEGPARQAAGKGYVDVPEVFMPTMASGIIANNVQVTFLAFAGGILAGLGTVVTLVTNGVSIGAVAGLFASHGLLLYLLAFILPHGVLELSAICIAGGAGLWLGSALVLPGRQTRRQALVERGREAVSLLAGTAFLLLLAGLLEGFVSPADLPFPAKYGASALSAVMLALYLLTPRRNF